MKELSFIRNYDTGMRRLGFLEVLLCDCVGSNRSTQEFLGEMLWNIVEEKQKKWLEKLGKMRGLEDIEVGRITTRTTGRFVKLATELGLLTEGPLKTLTDLGKLFTLFRRKQFFIDHNLGQQIILIREFLRKDDLVFLNIIGHIVETKTASLKDMFDWFVNHFIERVLAQQHKDLDAQLADRFSTTFSSYKSGDKRERRRGYDKVKHMLVPRLENIVDLDIISKKSGPFYLYTDKARIICQSIYEPLVQGKKLTDDDIFSNLAKVYGIYERAKIEDVLKETILGFNVIAEPPLKVVPIKVLRDFVCINSIISGKQIILPKDFERVEKFLSREFYGKVILFEDMEGHISHISIHDEVKDKLFANLHDYSRQIGE